VVAVAGSRQPPARATNSAGAAAAAVALLLVAAGIVLPRPLEAAEAQVLEERAQRCDTPGYNSEGGL